MAVRRFLAAAVAAAVVATATLAGSSTGSADSVLPATLLPTARLAIDDLSYTGAFRFSAAQFGESSVNYSAGPIGYNPEHRSLFVAGHAPQRAIAEFDIPDQLGTGSVVADLPEVETPRQPFATLLDRPPTGNPDGIDRVDGLYVHDGALIVNAEEWYDADGGASDTTLVLDDADDLEGPVDGYFELDGGVHAGGYMSDIPAEWEAALGGPVLTGWASNTSIISRHSVGPTLFAFDPTDVVGGTATTSDRISTQRRMDFPFQGQRYLGADALQTGPGDTTPSLWNHLARAPYGFIAPGTSTFVVLGHIGGTRSGIGYKITQSDGNLCGGYCPYDADDENNAYWLFDLNDILASDEPHLPRPYAFGRWDVPFDDGGRHAVIGATFDPVSGDLYVSLENAGQTGTYDRPPLIAVFSVPAAAGPTPTTIGSGITRSAAALRRAKRVSP